MSKQTVLEDRFALKQRLFSEGNQAAYVAHDRRRSEEVLLFLVPPAAKLTPEMDRAVRAEIERAFAVSAPSLLPVFDLREIADYRFLVMPRPRGTNAWSSITQKAKSAKSLTAQQALRVADDLIAAAEAAHARNTILGCSPKQVWVDPQRGAQVQYYWLERAHVGDDEADAPADARFETLSVEAGYFRAPELARGRAGAGPLADQFFICAILYGLLTGEVPSGTLAPIRRSRKDVPRPLAAAVEKGLAPDPDDRHGDLGSLRRALHKKPARLGGLVPLLLLLLGLWAGHALFRGGADAADYVLPPELEARREAAFLRARPTAAPVPTADADTLGRYAGRYERADPGTGAVALRLELFADGSFLGTDLAKDEPRRTRGLWWGDPRGLEGRGLHLQPVEDTAGHAAPWRARFADGALALERPGADRAILAKVGWVTTPGAPAVPLFDIDAPLVGSVLTDAAVEVTGAVAIAQTRVRVGDADVPVVGTRFTTVVEASGRGDLEIRVEASAPDGFVSRLARVVRVDTGPPQIAATATLQSVEGVWRLRVEGRAADDGRVAALSVNDEPLPLDAESRFTYERSGADAVAHAFVEVVAVDAVGRLTRRLLWPDVAATSSASLAPRFEAVEAALAAGKTDEAEDLLRAIRAAGGLIERLGPAKFARLVRSDRAPRVSLDDHPRPPAYFQDDGTRTISLAGGVDWFGPEDVLMVGGRRVEVRDQRFEARVQLAELGPNNVPIQVLRAGQADPVTRRDVEVWLAGADGDVPGWTGVPVSEAQREASARYGLAIGRTNQLGQRFVLVPPGAFFRTSSTGRRFEVRLTKPYYLQVAEVSRAQFRKLNPRALPGAYEAKSGKIPLTGDDRPAVGVSRNEAIAFARQLSSDEGGTFRLPTEAEWEYAARAGDVEGETYWGSDTAGAAAWANVADRSIQRVLRGWPDHLLAKVVDDRHAGPWNVGTGRANAFGLRDMLGNAPEWTRDAYGPYDASQTEDPRGPAGGSRGVWRGGGFFHKPDELGFARRPPSDARTARKTETYTGFRLLLEAEVR